MEKHFQKISGLIPNTLKKIDIELKGRNLIITGGNGSGKTCLLRELHRKAELLIVQKRMADLEQIRTHHNNFKNLLASETKGSSQYDRTQKNLDSYRNQLDEIESGLKLDINNSIEFSANLGERTAVLKMFEAKRTSSIAHADTAKGIDTEKQQAASNKTHNQSFGNSLEQHLVNLRNRRSLAITEDKNESLAQNISSWFMGFEKNLQILLEDKTAKLNFNSNTLKFTIAQEGKPEYTFQSLSSGYQAIFEIYADLLMRTEYFEITPENLTGVVFIDEIDAHLHVSLQRLIFPFFTKSFPNVQFLVTTHSPFVLTSAEDTVIFDLTRNSQVDEDISMYSYSAIIQGLLGAKPTSLLLEESINEIAEIINSDNIDYSRLEILVNKLKPNEDKLDSKSKSFFLMGENALLDKES
ncbi:AAA family ATPase [Simiduia curdlanivorans]|uniref:AAA family ATPase n=1 Tax=Simiduia curdlanivorans TaxID=1492769 RepID=A0ABV8V456_9GAMM|nr:AAA family ATPase [Simiduia curdlanivorans]MDN3637362.1 AAA family ATPase [Simiduia curdlanivorans]